MRVVTLALPVAAGIVGAAAVYVAAGPSLNLLLGGAAVVALLTPTVSQQQPRTRWRASTIFAGALALSWMSLVINHAISLVQWFAAAAVLMSIMSVEVAAGEFLESMGVPEMSAGAMVLLAVLAWGSWPVWGSLRLGDAGAPITVAVHPLFALNGVAPLLGIWTEQPAPYRLTAFGQNVVYRLPSTVFYCVALHGGLAMAMWSAARGGKFFRRPDPAISE